MSSNLSSSSLPDLRLAICRSLPDSSSFHHRALMGCMLELSCFEQTSTLRNEKVSVRTIRTNCERDGVFSTFHPKIDTETHKKRKRNMIPSKQYESCIEACHECVTECEHCAVSCLHEQDIKMMVRFIELVRDCADMCSLAAQFMSRGSTYAAKLCALCADICQACGDECAKRKNEHCQPCAKACHKCAEECRNMAKK